MRRERLNRIAVLALSRVEAYLIVLVVFATVIVVILGGWPGWLIPVSLGAGAVLLVLLVLDSLSDPGADQAAAFADIDPKRIHDSDLRAKLIRALEYVRAAQRLAQRYPSGVLDAADDELPQLEEAVRSIFRMSLRLQEFRADKLIGRDLAELQRQRSRGGRLSPKQEEQMRTLERLEELVRTAYREIDDALAHLGRSYAEMQAIQVTPEFRGREAYVFKELDASTARLSDLAARYDEAFGSRRAPGDRRADK
jgi:hypothetical protein